MADEILAEADQLAREWLATTPCLPNPDAEPSPRQVREAAAVLTVLARCGEEGSVGSDARERRGTSDEIAAAARRFARLLLDGERDAPDVGQLASAGIAGCLRSFGDAVRSVAGSAPSDDAHGADLSRTLAEFNASVAEAFVEEGARAERAVRGALEVFTRTLSHELKNPIGAAEGAAEMLLDDAITTDPDQRRRFASMVARNLKRANELVMDLRALAVARADGTRSQRIRPLRALAEDALHEVTPTAAERGITVSLVEPFASGPVDGSRVALVLMNLVWNAVKYADLEKADRWVRVGARVGMEGGWHCFVSDNGLGIPEAEQERVFEIFSRAHPGEASGTGVGLTITREALDQIGGRVWVESEPGLGSTFHFTVPPAAATPRAGGPDVG